MVICRKSAIGRMAAVARDLPAQRKRLGPIVEPSHEASTGRQPSGNVLALGDNSTTFQNRFTSDGIASTCRMPGVYRALPLRLVQGLTQQLPYDMKSGLTLRLLVRRASIPPACTIASRKKNPDPIDVRPRDYLFGLRRSLRSAFSSVSLEPTICTAGLADLTFVCSFMCTASQ